MGKRKKPRRGAGNATPPQKAPEAKASPQVADETSEVDVTVDGDAIPAEDGTGDASEAPRGNDDATTPAPAEPTADVEIRETASPVQADADIRGVLIQVTGSRLLLPNATIAEVLSYADPEPVEGAPDWLLGRIRWRGWQLPLVAFGRLTGTATDERGGLGSKVLVVKAFGGNPKLPFFALLTQGFPRLVTVSRDGLVQVEPDGALPDAVHAAVLLNEDEALLPDIDRVEALLADALAKAA